MKFQPVENSMPKPLLPQPDLSAGLESKTEKNEEQSNETLYRLSK